MAALGRCEGGRELYSSVGDEEDRERRKIKKKTDKWALLSVADSTFDVSDWSHPLSTK